MNVGWARALEAAGGHVVRGLVGLKNHAKIALVVRREGETIRRYAHIGTGNYNLRSGEQYTDFSLFTTDSAITNDIADLFNELTGTSDAPRRPSEALLVAPHHLLPGILKRIEREAQHARAGNPARIVAKLNGLSDPDVVRALYRARARWRGDRPHRARNLHAQAGRGWALRAHSRDLGRRAFPRAFAHLPLR